MSERRTERLNLRVSSEERAAIERRASDAGISLSAYLRKRALKNDNEPIMHVDTDTLKKIYANLRKCGSNLNQCAYRLNTRRSSDHVEQELEEALREVASASSVIARTIAEARRFV